MREEIQAGLMVFVADGQAGVGAVREVRKGTSEMVVNIQNAGDFVLPLTAVHDVHSGKIILDLDRLDAPLREALKHVHDGEDPAFAALDRVDGTPNNS